MSAYLPFPVSSARQTSSLGTEKEKLLLKRPQVTLSSGSGQVQVVLMQSFMPESHFHQWRSELQPLLLLKEGALWVSAGWPSYQENAKIWMLGMHRTHHWGWRGNWCLVWDVEGTLLHAAMRPAVHSKGTVFLVWIWWYPILARLLQQCE